MQNQFSLIRLKQEYELCIHDNELIQIGCNFGLENDNIFSWRITMVGPRGTPYEAGLFTLIAKFPNDYPIHGPEFKFLNKIYHLNVDFKNQESLGSICINNLNEWKTTGIVKNYPYYTVKQALFDIFSLFYVRGFKEDDSNYLSASARIPSLRQFDEEAKKWTQLYASM